MSNYNIEEMARGMGFNDSYLNKLRATNQFITESANQDRNKINSQLNQTLADYEKERQDQNQNFIKDAQSAYVDYAKAINPYSAQRSQANRVGLGNSGYSESSLIGANNAYQNRYTDTKTNYDNIFANINNNIAKARETSNIELAKIAQNEQDRLLDNLYRLNDLYSAEKQQEEEKRRWEAEMALQRAAAARSSRKSSGGNTVAINQTDNTPKEQPTMSGNASTLFASLQKTMASNKGKPTESAVRNIVSNTINNAFKQGKISETDVRLMGSGLGL